MKTALLNLVVCLLLAGCASNQTKDSSGSTDRSTTMIPMTAAPKADAETISKYVQAHPELPQEVKQAMLSQKPAAGMTPEQLTLVWGSPAEAKQILGISGKREEWNYPDGRQARFQLGLLYEWK